MHKALIAAALLCACLLPRAHAAEQWLAGNIVNVTSSSQGLMILLDTGIPDNCQGTPYNWMLIKQADKTMVAVAIALWIAGKPAVTVYTIPPAGPGSFCTVNQLDPAG